MTDQDEKFVTVLTANREDTIQLARSLLDDAGIPYLMTNSFSQDMFGLGRIGYNPLGRVADIQVRREDEAAARAILADLSESRSARMSPLIRWAIIIFFLVLPLLILAIQAIMGRL